MYALLRQFNLLLYPLFQRVCLHKPYEELTMGKKPKETVKLKETCTVHTKLMELLQIVNGPDHQRVELSMQEGDTFLRCDDNVLVTCSDDVYLGYEEFSSAKGCTLRTILQTMIALDAQRQASNLKTEKHFAVMETMLLAAE